MNERIEMNRPLVDQRTKIKSVTLNGKRMPLQDAKISIMSPGLSYAATVFEGLRAYWNEEQGQLFIFRLDDHLKRLENSMKMLRFDAPPSSADLRAQIIEDIRANEYREDTYIRVQAFIDEWGEMNATGPVSTSIVSRPRPRAPAFETGLNFGITSWQRLSDNASPPRIKAAANYLNSRLAGLDAKAGGYQGAIILTEKGTLSEGPGGCIFLVRDGVLITPGVTSGILESITREVLLTLAQEAGLQTVERDVDRTELYIADEVFYCGTGQELVPILSIDRLLVGDGKPGPITRQLQASYDKQVRARAHNHPEWQTPVYEMSNGKNQ